MALRLFIIFFVALPAMAATWPAATANLSDVQSAVGLAANGDTVTIPAGNVSWAGSGLSTTKALAFIGAGIGLTVITDDVVDANNSTMALTLVNNYTSRVSGISFKGGTHTGNYGGLRVDGNYTNNSYYRFDHLSFTNIGGRTSLLINGAKGVMDHCYVAENGNTFWADVRGTASGDVEWSQDTAFGTDKFAFFEDCVFVQSGSLYDVIDSYAGGRWVVRYCTIINGRFATHGADSTVNSRSTRALEVYNCTIGGNGVNSGLAQLRGGCAVYHDLTITNWNNAFPCIDLHCYRGIDGEGGEFVPWGGADGTNAWDINDPGNPFETGTATGGSSLTMIKGGAAWTPNQWIGYTLRNLTALNFSEITSNSPTTITFKPGTYNGNMTFINNHVYNITKVTQAIDQPGVGKGALVSTTGTATNPNQAIEPVYAWNSTVNGTTIRLSSDSYIVVTNTHFIGSSMPGYVAYSYPHPLQGSVPPPPNVMHTVRANIGRIIPAP